VRKGEGVIRKAIEVSPGIINGYTLLAQNLFRQKRYEEAFETCKMMLNCTPHEETPDAAVDGMKCMSECLVHMKAGQLLEPLMQTAIAKYPKLKERLEKVFIVVGGGGRGEGNGEFARKYC